MQKTVHLHVLCLSLNLATTEAHVIYLFTFLLNQYTISIMILIRDLTAF
jgi:hypothetical protein